MDISKIKEELNQFKNDGQQVTENKEDGKVFKPEFGDQLIRIVPYIYDKDMPFIKLYWHYNFMGKHYLSPFSFGERDPIVEFSEKLISRGNKEDFKLGKKIQPKLRIYAPIIVRGKEHEGVKFWGFSKTIYKEILKIMDDPDYGDITDLRQGRDITLRKIPAEQTEGNYPEFDIIVKPNKTPVTNDRNVFELIKKQYNIRDVFYVPDYEKLSNLLEQWIQQKEGSNDEEFKGSNSEHIKQESKSIHNADISPSEKFASDNFGDLFDDNKNDVFDDKAKSETKNTENNNADDMKSIGDKFEELFND